MLLMPKHKYATYDKAYKSLHQQVMPVSLRRSDPCWLWIFMNTCEILLEHWATHAAAQMWKVNSHPTRGQHAITGIWRGVEGAPWSEGMRRRDRIALPVVI
ncbi:unnamed protein product [Cercospora beticola]|nr:unnamed protein product [Cercospora beticola]